MKTATWTLTGLCSALHLMVDGLCLCCLYMVAERYGQSVLFPAFIAYNILAFLSQPFTGWLIDRMHRRHNMLLAADAFLALALLATAMAMTSANALAEQIGLCLMTVFLGVGNSCFHVWGGKIVAVRSKNDMRHLGLFVSTGVMGLALAIVFGAWPLAFGFLGGIILLSGISMSLDFRLWHNDFPKNPKRKVPVAPIWAGILLLGLVGFVVFRSFFSSSYTSYLGNARNMVLLVGIVSMCGKAAGGWLARVAGLVPTFALLIVAVLVCDFFAASGSQVMLTGLFLINCTMPITLYLANILLPDREGLAFGILAAALVPGLLMFVG